MKKMIFVFAVVFAMQLYADAKPIRVAVIGGLTMSGLWEQISVAFEKKYGIKTELVVTGNKKVLHTFCLENPVDMVTMHSSDTIANLASSGYVEGLTPWIHNAQMIVFDKSNPARLSENDTLRHALRKIMDTQSLFVMYPSVGSFEVFHELDSQYAFKPKMFFTQKSYHFLDVVVSYKGYTLFGVIPYLMKKHRHPQIEGVVIEDKALRRPYLAAVGTEQRIGNERHQNAKLLLDFLASAEVQTMIRNFRLEGFPQIPVFFPTTTLGQKE